jgi:hypothetical protein
MPLKAIKATVKARQILLCLRVFPCDETHEGLDESWEIFWSAAPMPCPPNESVFFVQVPGRFEDLRPDRHARSYVACTCSGDLPPEIHSLCFGAVRNARKLTAQLVQTHHRTPRYIYWCSTFPGRAKRRSPGSLCPPVGAWRPPRAIGELAK